MEHSPKTNERETKDRVSTIRPLRIWPVVMLLFCMWALRAGGGLFDESSPTVLLIRFVMPLIFGGLIVLWWVFLSRASLTEKLLGVVGLATILVVTTVLADKTIRIFGTMIFAVPWGFTAFSVAMIGLSQMRSSWRTWYGLLAALVGFGYWDLVRTDEIRGDFGAKHSWRWQPTAEDRFLKSLASRSKNEDAPTNPDQQPLAKPEWPEFRGPHRDGVQESVVLGEDWQAQPLQVIWRIKVGPGWSSFSVAGDRLFTQEQRGDFEAVVCYNANTGRENWTHQDKSRFWEVVSGAGPRSTPTLSDGKLFALGGGGLLHRLDPVTGEQVWQRDINEDADREPPMWGYASSPLVAGGAVIVYAGGAGDKGLLAYDSQSGDLRWSCRAGDHSYSSPQLSELGGKQCVLMLTNNGLTFVDPADGALLGEHNWEYKGYRVVQPLVLDDSSVLLGTAMGNGTQRITVRWDGKRFLTDESWLSRRINPYFNDYVAHKDHLYGFDNNIFTCVDLATGKRKWKKGRYGNGQVLLLPRGDQLLVLSEQGELVLLRATPDKLVELARKQVLSGRTWNHPVLVGHRLYVRNGEEAVCIEAPVTYSANDGAAEP